jgi:hypothetical protein
MIAKHMMHNKLDISDELRHPDTIYALIFHCINNSSSNILYEVDDMKALLGITNILPKFKADVIFKVFDKSFFGFKFITQVKALFKSVMKEYELIRLNTVSPDPSMVRIAKMCGFEVEGMMPKNFMWASKLYTVAIMGLQRKEE